MNTAGKLRTASRYVLAELPVHGVPFSDIGYGRGHLNLLTPQPDGTLQVKGWLTTPGEPTDSIEVHHAGHRLGEYPMISRPDVAKAFDWLPYAGTSGFLFMLPLSDEQIVSTTRLDIVSIRDKQRRGRLSQLVRTDLYEFPSAQNI